MKKEGVCAVEIVLGLAVTGQKKLVAAVESLVKKGELSKQQSQAFLREAQSEGAACKKKVGDQFRDSAKKVLGELGLVTADDLAKIHKEISGLKAAMKAPRAATKA
ncbi:MAG TPA: hypothetical protein PLH01_03830 [Kiritimatiellia bacterium]|nr:hypothetical protein [Kiritimatiellia bacterium]HPK37387.1 hypothetical protein [Kiritimatiellia bacterium]